jgi:hypothetical protein
VIALEAAPLNVDIVVAETVTVLFEQGPEARLEAKAMSWMVRVVM